MKSAAISWADGFQVAPSLLAAPSGSLGEAIKAVEGAGAGMIHIDIMDGEFVPNLSFGPKVVADLRQGSALLFDVHLMVEHPLRFAKTFVAAGADILTVHLESSTGVAEVRDFCRENRTGFGIALRPATPIAAVAEHAGHVDLLLVMGVNPGFGGQTFIADTIRRVAEAAEMRAKLRARYLISVDGGIDQAIAGACRRAGADVVVAGTSIFQHRDIRAAIRSLKG